MSKAKKKDSNQPELPIHNLGQPVAPSARRKKPANGNGQVHVQAEQVATVAHRPFDPNQPHQPLHRRVDRGFLDDASYVIRDRVIPNLAFLRSVFPTA